MKIKQISFLIFAFLVLIFPISIFGTAQPIGPFYNDLVLEYGATGLEVKAPLSAAYGGTGVVNNVLNTITFTGEYTLGLTLTANTTITLPTSGTMLTSASKLSDLAATTSAELITVISDETGGGLLVFGTSPNITTPTGIVKGDVGLGNVENIKIKLDATTAPTVNDDVDLGYSVGSTWIDITNDKGYICLDNTDGAAIWTEVTLAGSGYTNLTSFVDQTAWRVFYSNADGDVIELALGVDGTYLRSNGAAAAPTFGTPSGAGDMLKATYDTDTDGDIDVAAGGTEKSSWTLYAIPYLSGTTTFGEIPIGTAEYCLTVNAGATGYDWTLFDLSLYYLKTEIDTQGEMETIWGDTLMNDLVDDPDPELGGEMDAGAHSIGFTLQTTTGDGTTTIDWRLGNKFEFTFGAQNDTFTFTAPTNPGNFMLWLIQDGTGSRTMTWPATVRWPGGTAPTLSTAANAVDIISFVWNGTNYDGVASFAFAVP